VGTRRDNIGIGRKEKKEGAECATRDMWSGYSEIRERERKEWGEILNEDRREVGWMKEIWKRRDRMAKERGIERKNVIIFVIVISLDKTLTVNK
jgi:ribonuclease D